MDRWILIPIGITIGLVVASVYVAYDIWNTNLGAPTSEYCSKTIPIIYINTTTALTNNERCLDYLLSNYSLIDKNGSYYILESKK